MGSYVVYTRVGPMTSMQYLREASIRRQLGTANMVVVRVRVRHWEGMSDICQMYVRYMSDACHMHVRANRVGVRVRQQGREPSHDLTCI